MENYADHEDEDGAEFERHFSFPCYDECQQYRETIVGDRGVENSKAVYSLCRGTEERTIST